MENKKYIEISQRRTSSGVVAWAHDCSRKGGMKLAAAAPRDRCDESSLLSGVTSDSASARARALIIAILLLYSAPNCCV